MSQLRDLSGCEPQPVRPHLLEGIARLSWLPRCLAALAIVLSLAGSAYFGATRHPDYSVPRGKVAQTRISQLVGNPSSADDVLIGDLLIERFYAVEPTTGRRLVGDMCKGRVTDLVESSTPAGTVKYSVLLDRRNLNAAKIRGLVQRSWPPEPDASYMGVRVQNGDDDVFPVNYSGRLPKKRVDFRTAQGWDVYTYLAGVTTDQVGGAQHVLSINERIFLLSSTKIYPYFASLFRTQDAVFVTELEFVDATSPEAVASMSE